MSTENEFQPITSLMTIIGGKKISASVHTDYQKLVYTENNLVSTVNEISVHQFLKISVSAQTH